MEVIETKNPLSFPCPGCGGSMHFDAEGQALKCEYCGRVEQIENLQQQPIEYDLDLADAEANSRTDWGFKKQTIHCESCGGESIIPEHQTTTLCAFCGSPKVIRQDDQASIRPETMIPFQVSFEEATAAFQKWKKKRWFVPNAFKESKISSKLTSIYIPYWTFDSLTDSAYTAQRGDYRYRTETRTRTVNGKRETYTTQVRYTVWRSVSGEYHRFFDDVLIPASSGHDHRLLNKLGNFDLKQLTGYKPEYLSGIAAEKYSISLKEGWHKAGQRIDGAIESGIRAQIGGDEIRLLNIRTFYSNKTYKHILLPVWNANYSYRSKPYRYMVNGQTGLVSGTVPRSPWKITFFVLVCIIIASIVALLVSQNT